MIPLSVGMEAPAQRQSMVAMTEDFVKYLPSVGYP
jgi:hypothetical protein